MKREDLQLQQLIRFIGKDPMGIFNCAHIWKVTAIEGDRISLTDMRGTYIKSHSLAILKDFEVFVPTDDAPKIDWKTKYLGVVK